MISKINYYFKDFRELKKKLYIKFTIVQNWSEEIDQTMGYL